MAKFVNLVQENNILVDADILAAYKDISAFITKNGYVELQFSRKRKPRRREFLHRLIVPNHRVVHHIDNNKLNNLRSNLLGTNQSTNLLFKKLKTDSTTRGTRLHKQSGLYQARIRVNCKDISLGYFKTLEEAKAAYDAGYAKLVADRLEGHVR